MSQVLKKFLAYGAIPSQTNNTWVTSRNAADTADVNMIQVDASDVVQLASGAQISGTPSTGNAIANKTYVDSAVSGSAGANTALSNLVSPAVNTAILPATDNATNFGSSVKRWLSGYFMNLPDSTGTVSVDITNRALKNTSGTTLVDFSGTNAQTSVAPSVGNDICNKTYVDSVASNQKTWNYEPLTLSGTDITNQYKDLAQVAITGSIDFFVNGIWQRPTTDYTINYTGGTGGKTRLTFAGDLATAGAAALVSGDVIHISYQY